MNEAINKILEGERKRAAENLAQIDDAIRFFNALPEIHRSPGERDIVPRKCVPRSGGLEMANDRLLPCPFCGESEHLRIGVGVGAFWVTCTTCSAAGPAQGSGLNAQRAWNRAPREQGGDRG